MIHFFCFYVAPTDRDLAKGVMNQKHFSSEDINKEPEEQSQLNCLLVYLIPRTYTYKGKTINNPIV